MVQTDTKELAAGDCILWEYNTQRSRDAFEILVAIFDARDEMVAHELKRGNVQLDWTYGQVQIATPGTYFLRFFLGSYDATGGGLVGARMEVRNVRFSDTCLDDNSLRLGPLASSTTRSTVSYTSTSQTRNSVINTSTTSTTTSSTNTSTTSTTASTTTTWTQTAS